METVTEAHSTIDGTISVTRLFLLVAGVLVLGIVSVWAFTHGIEPRRMLGGSHPHAVSAVAAVCIAAWGYLLVFLFRGIFSRRLSAGWCPILLVAACAILFLVLGCFGAWAGV
jgi:lysylphosphatidylglycerol synthetase-like protein (DUF2156 family)